MAQVIWTQKALSQYKQAINWIRANEGVAHARPIAAKVEQWVELLETTPKAGTVEPLLRHKRFEYRFVLVYRFKMIYRRSNNRVIIVRFFHTSRRPGKIFE